MNWTRFNFTFEHPADLLHDIGITSDILVDQLLNIIKFIHLNHNLTALKENSGAWRLSDPSPLWHQSV